MSIYKKRAKADEVNKEGGYKNKVFFCPIADFLSIKKPVGPFVNPGDKFKIATAHTFTAPAGFISFDCKKHAVTTTAETTGEDGSKSLTYKFKFVLLGDDAITQEYLETMLNDDVLVLVKDQDCLNATDHTQFGDECLTPDFTVTFDGKTTKEGLKEWNIEGSVKGKRFFYSAAVTEKVVA